MIFLICNTSFENDSDKLYKPDEKLSLIKYFQLNPLNNEDKKKF